MKKIIIIQSIIIGVFIFYFSVNFLTEKTKTEQIIKSEKISLFKDIPNEYKGRIKTPNKYRIYYENKMLGFLLDLPSPVLFYGEMIKTLPEKEGSGEKESYIVSFYKMSNSFIFPISARESIDPITAIEIRITPDEFSSLDDWISFQKTNEVGGYFLTRTFNDVILGGEKAIRIIDTLDNKPDIKGKYFTQERTIVYHKNKIFDMSIHTSEVTSQDDVNLIWDSFKFLD